MRALFFWLMDWAPCPNGSPEWLCDFSKRFCIACRLKAYRRLMEG